MVTRGPYLFAVRACSTQVQVSHYADFLHVPTFAHIFEHISPLHITPNELAHTTLFHP